MATMQITVEEVHRLLAGLYTNSVSTKQIDEAQPVADPKVAATYVDNDGHLRFGIICELALANSLGAALTLIPVGGADDATADGSVPENIAENLNEVFNICAAIFAHGGHERIVLDRVILPGDEASKGFTQERLLDLRLEIDRYTPGQLSFVAANHG